MEATASLITKSVDSALSQIKFVDKSLFYQLLESVYHVKPQEIGENFETFHDALKHEFGSDHFKIDRLIIRCLHQQSKKEGIAATCIEINAFYRITNDFAAEITNNLIKNKELADSKAYAKRLEAKVKVYDAKLKSAEHLATIGQTAAMVGHDLRNPLQAIAGDMYLIESDVANISDCEIKKKHSGKRKQYSSQLILHE